MTSNELLALSNHARIKYIGTRPMSELFPSVHRGCELSDKGKGHCGYDCSIKKMPKTFLTKGIIVLLTSSNWDKDISIHYYGGSIYKADPAEWELVDARKWVERQSEYKRVKAYIPMVARRFKAETKAFLSRYKNSIEYKLDSLPVDQKLKLIMELSSDDKKWFGIMNAAPDEVIALIEKAFENHDL